MFIHHGNQHLSTAKNEAAASAVEDAIQRVLDDGYRTVDIAGAAKEKVISTEEMGSLVAQYAIENAKQTQAYHAV